MRLFFASAVLAMLSLGSAQAEMSPAQAGISVAKAQVKLGIGQRPAVLHGVVTNPSLTATRLIAASSQAFERIELHTHIISRDGNMRMQAVDSFALPAKGKLALKPGGHHLMLFGFSGTAGDKVSLRLSFADGRTLEFEAPTKARARRDSHAAPQKRPNHAHR